MVEAAVAAFSRSAQPHPLPPPSPLTLLPPLRRFLLRVSLSSLFLRQLFTFISPNSHFCPPRMSTSHVQPSFSVLSFFFLLTPLPVARHPAVHSDRSVSHLLLHAALPLGRASPVHPHAACISEESLSADACTRSVRLSAQCVDHSSSGAGVERRRGEGEGGEGIGRSLGGTEINFIGNCGSAEAEPFFSL